MGGNAPLGYDANERTLVISPAGVETVRRIFALYRELGCVRRVKEEADRLGLRTKCSTTANGTERGGKPFPRGHIYTVLSNPIYTGQIAHKDQLYPGQHPALIDADSWAAVKAIARGRAWFEELATGRARSLQELAKRDGISRRYIRRLVGLAFLSRSWSRRSCRAGNPSSSPRHGCPNSICRWTGPNSTNCSQANRKLRQMCPRPRDDRGRASFAKGQNFREVGLDQCPSERKGEGVPVRRLHVPSHVPIHP
jgi:hypothetical protein